MFRTPLTIIVFIAGLAAVCLTGAAYLGSSLPDTAMALVMGACYVAGAVELHRYRQATATLTRAVAGLDSPPTALAGWLEQLHPALRGAVRLRIAGERAALPAPALTPYLTGLLVLLGMLGTLLGMVSTLHGAGMALADATDLQAIRAALAAPVRCLGFAFGTSIAGVASSAALGLLSALSQRERLQALRRLDAGIDSTLRVHTRAYQREESLRLLRQQGAVMPALLERLQSMTTALERQAGESAARQAASQDAFHARTETLQAHLAASLEQSVRNGIAEGARAVAAALGPVTEAALAGLAREAAVVQAGLTTAAARQLTGMATAFAEGNRGIAASWHEALSRQEALNARLVDHSQRAVAGLIDGLRRQLEDASSRETAAQEERARLAGGLQSLLDAVRAQSGGVGTATARLEAGAIEVAGLAEAFGAAVQLFDRSGAALVEQLLRISDSLDQSRTRSDEQLTYYVAQAREIIDLSLLSQRQVIEDLRRMAGAQAGAGTA